MRKLFCKITLLITLCFCWYTTVTPITIYIKECKLYLSQVEIVQMNFLLVMAGYFLKDLQKTCRHADIVEMAYNLFPTEFMLMLIFAQHHLKWTIWIIILLWILITIFAYKWYMDFFQTNIFCKANKRRFHKIKQCMYRRYKQQLIRCAVLLFGILFLIPSILVTTKYGYQQPVKTFDEKINIIKEYKEEITIQDLMKNNNTIFYQLTNWNELTENQKLQILQQIADMETTYMGIPKVKIQALKLKKYVLGEYDWGTKNIRMDIEHLCQDSMEECLNTVLHEIYHYFQYYTVMSIQWNKEEQRNMYFRSAKRWKENVMFYYDAVEYGYDDYEKQPLEQDARKYSEEETKIYMIYIKQYLESMELVQQNKMAK